MDATFKYPMDYVMESIEKFDSYMERASLQFKVELEGRAKAILDPSSSALFTEEATGSFMEKLKRGFELIKRRLMELIQDTRANFMKYRADKAMKKRMKKLQDMLSKYPILKKIKVPYADMSPMFRFIEREKLALKRMVRKPGTTKEEIKLFMKKYVERMTLKQKILSAAAFITIAALFTGSIIQGFEMELDRIQKDVQDTNADDPMLAKMESDFAEAMGEYTSAYSKMTADEIKFCREMMTNMDKALRDAENSVYSEANKLEKGEDEDE